MVIAALAIVFAMVGTAVAGTDGISSKLTKSSVKKIAKKQANKQITARAPGLAVASAATADAVSSQVMFGPVTVAEGAADTTLASHGPLSIVASCDLDGTATESNVLVASTENNTGFGGDDEDAGDLGPATPEANRIIEDPGASSSAAQEHSDGYDDTFSMIAPSGAAMHGVVSSLANGTANTCTYYGSVTLVH
jgi:hypothetical protein